MQNYCDTKNNNKKKNRGQTLTYATPCMNKKKEILSTFMYFITLDKNFSNSLIIHNYNL